MKFLLLIFTPLLVNYVNLYLKKNSFLLNYSGDRHQKFTLEKKIPLSGGIFILIFFLLFFNNQSLVFNIFAILIFLLGFYSDLKIFNSAKGRFIFQIIILYFFIYLIDLKLENTKVILIDQIIRNEIINYIFVLFCILILINGTNFIDGLNTNALGYYIVLSIVLLHVASFNSFNFEFNNWIYWIIILFILYLFNLYQKLFIGDNGAYLLGFIYGYLLINIYINNQGISPFFIVLLVWYPCFETLFSIFRKFRFNKSPILPDTKHLHQVVYISVKKSFKLSSLKANNISANLINIYNLISMCFASIKVSDTQYQIIIIIINILVYCYVYFRLFNNNYKKN